MARLDRNSASANRLRRNFQKLQSSTASTSIALSPSPNNALVTTSTGYGVFVDGSTITNANSTLSVILEPGGGLSSYPAGVGTILASTGELITFSSTGVDVALPAGSPGQVLTVLDATSTIGWSTGGSTGGSSTIIVASTGISVSTSGASTFITNTSTGSTFIVLAGNPGISTSTDPTSTSTYVFNTDVFVASTGISLSTSGASTFITNTQSAGSTFFVLAGNPGISTSTNSTSTFVFNNDVFIASTGIAISTSSNSTFITNTQPPGSTFFVLSGNSGICTSTSGLSTFVLNNDVFVPSTGIAISTSGNSTIITNTQLAGSTFFVLAGNTGISTSTSTSANSTSTFIFNTDVFVASTGISLSTSGASTFITNTSTFQSTQVLPVFAGDPGSPTDGQAWYNSSIQRPRFQIGGSTTTGVTTLLATGGAASVQASTGALTLTSYSFVFPGGFLSHPSAAVMLRIFPSFTAAVANTWTFQLLINGTPFMTVFVDSLSIGQSAILDVNIALYVTGGGGSGNIAGTGYYVGTAAGTGVQGVLGINNMTVDLTSPVTISWAASASSTTASDTATINTGNYQLIR